MDFDHHGTRSEKEPSGNPNEFKPFDKSAGGLR
jgi:hypothetical protein